MQIVGKFGIIEVTGLLYPAKATQKTKKQPVLGSLDYDIEQHRQKREESPLREE